MRIIVTGSMAYDHILDFPQKFADHIMPDKLHVLSVSFLVDNFSKNFGGTAGGIAYTLGLLGNEVAILSNLGKDAKEYLKHLQKNGVDTALIKIGKKDFTANLFVITDRADCQIAGFYPGAMKRDNYLKLPEACDFLVISPTMPEAMESFVKQAKFKRIRYLYAPAQQIPRLTKEQLLRGINGAEILIGNDYELALVEEKTAMKKKQLAKMVKILIITLGEKGSIIYTQGKEISIPIVKPKKLVDPTGAGDAFIAGFLHGYLNGEKVKIAGQMAALAASYVLEQYGTQNHRFDSTSFGTRYVKVFKKQ